MTAFLAVIIYIGQPGVNQIVPESYTDGRRITRAKHIHTNITSPPSTTNTSFPPQHIVAHPFSPVDKVCIGVVVFICVTRFLFVLYSVLYIRTYDKHSIELQSLDVSSAADGSASSSHDPSEVEIQ